MKANTQHLKNTTVEEYNGKWQQFNSKMALDLEHQLFQGPSPSNKSSKLELNLRSSHAFQNPKPIKNSNFSRSSWIRPSFT
jgi:hypothetical protein